MLLNAKLTGPVLSSMHFNFKKQVGFLFDLAKKHESKGGSLALFQADLLVEAPFESAAAGCLAFVHVASPVVGGGTLRCCCTTAYFVDADADLDLDDIMPSI